MIAHSPKIAIISDVHGNSWALRAVLKDIAGRGVDRIVSLGDNAYGPLDPCGSMRLMREHFIPSVCGNEDRILVEHDSDATRASHRDYTVENLTPHDVQWLSQLKMTLYLKEYICLCHATPTRPSSQWSLMLKAAWHVSRTSHK